ncbi:hypothetical protein OZX57_01275 [Bifidobacterium sp. ESL0682]|uniref:hypothetical protein n=1 Tax=Bifidobacterium sp. ESL0682 TaxID=2983212 RepID=UPI0023F872C2|nr:hypothetical protein [Bifidobacterium sp. ESL0682]WEV42158.1 hypothetical protein OZX57_01275 [Bifidobacterium sp. ESL0682]
MGFDLFMGGLAVVLAALATWLIILFFRSSISDRSPVEAALQGLRNPNNGNDDDHDSDDSAPGAQITDQISRISRLLILAVVLTVIVFIPSLLNRFSTSLVPDWLVNPWLQAIVTTPTMFLCGAPIHREGWHALSRRAPDVNSLISLGATGAFIYSLAICVAGNQFPEGSQHAYFGGVNLIITLALAIELVELLILRDVKQSQDSMNPVTASQQAASATTKASAASSSTMAASTQAPRAMPLPTVLLIRLLPASENSHISPVFSSSPSSSSRFGRSRCWWYSVRSRA